MFKIIEQKKLLNIVDAKINIFFDMAKKLSLTIPSPSSFHPPSRAGYFPYSTTTLPLVFLWSSFSLPSAKQTKLAPEKRCQPEALWDYRLGYMTKAVLPTNSDKAAG